MELMQCIAAQEIVNGLRFMCQVSSRGSINMLLNE